MKSIRSYSDEALLQETKTLVAKERQTTLQLIECLQEVEIRMLYAHLGFSSLWNFCTQFLGLSEGSSQRRIAAMRLSRAVPEVKDAIADGKLTLSNVSKLESFFQSEKKSGRPQTTEQKKETIQKMEGLSQTECTKELFKISPQFEVEQKESLKPISADQSELKIVLDSKAVEQLKLLKDRLSHSHPNASYTELIQVLIEDKLAQIEKKMKIKEPTQPKNSPQQEKPQEEKKGSATAAAIVPLRREHESREQSFQRKPIPMSTQRALWERSGGRCEYIAPDGKRCSSARFLEIDHVTPVARGGSNDLSSIRHTCKIHNGYFAKEVFSSDWMEQYLPRLRRSESL